MMRGPTLAALVTAVALLALPAPAGAALRWGKCEGEGHQCARLEVPLDHSGEVAGSLSLHVVRGQPFSRVLREEGATLMLGGDPGEAITERVRARLTFHLRLLDELGVDARATAGRDRPLP